MRAPQAPGAGATLTLASALALALAALPPAIQSARAQDARDPAAGPSELESPLGAAPEGTPGGLEPEPRPGPEPEPLPEAGTLVSPGPEVADGEPLGGAVAPAAPGLPVTGGAGLAVEGDPVAEPDLGLAGEPLGGAGDLDPEAVLLDPLDDPLGVGLDAAPGLLGPARPRAGLRRAAPALDRDRLAERGDGGPTLGFGLATRLRAESNPGLRFEGGQGRVEAIAELDFALASRTRRQRLALELDADLAASSDPRAGEDTVTLDEPRLGFGYDREGARSRLGAALRLRRRDLDEARLIDLDDPFDLLPDDDELVISGGTRTDLDAEVELAAGIDRPVGLELELRADLRRYEDTADADLTDRDILGAEAAIRLRASPLLTGRLRFGATDLDDASGETRESRSAGVTGVYAATQRTRLTAALGHTRVEALRRRDLDGDGEADALVAGETEGIEASLGVVRDMPSGTLSAEVETEVEEGGRRDSVRVARAFEPLPDTALATSLGLTRDEDGDEASVVGDLVLERALPRGAITATLRRRVGTDADGEEVAATTAGLGLFRDLGRASRLALDFDHAVVEEAGGDASQSELRLTYVRALTPDWSLRAGYELTRRAEGSRAATSNAVFVGLGREFLVRP